MLHGHQSDRVDGVRGADLNGSREDDVEGAAFVILLVGVLRRLLLQLVLVLLMPASMLLEVRRMAKLLSALFALESRFSVVEHRVILQAVSPREHFIALVAPKRPAVLVVAAAARGLDVTLAVVVRLVDGGVGQNVQRVVQAASEDESRTRRGHFEL